MVDKESLADKVPDRSALENAKRLARTDDEIAAVRGAERECDAIDKAVQSKADQDFLAHARELRQRVDEIDKHSEASPDATLDKLAHVSQELSKLLSGGAKISDAAKQPADALQARIQTLDEEAKTAGERLTREEAVTAALGDNDAFRAALLAYAEKAPHARRSASFREVAQREPPLWAWLAEWNGMVESLGRRNLRRMATRRIVGRNGGHAAETARRSARLSRRRRLPAIACLIWTRLSTARIATASQPMRRLSRSSPIR